jgi:hypothetical protein
VSGLHSLHSVCVEKLSLVLPEGKMNPIEDVLQFHSIMLSICPALRERAKK